MADSNIGALPQAVNLDDDSLLVAEQQGQAVKVTGAQFKEFGRQAVIGQVQGYVDQAQAAANQAADAVSAVTDMTVEASTLPSGQDAAVTKTTKNGKVNLAFGLPRGEQGIPGPEGKPGPRGPQGPTGKGLTILGYYDTLTALEDAVPNPEPGDPYGVGTEAPYSIYVFDGVTGAWKDNGQLSGGGGGPLPENVVTAEGGASMTFPLDLGDGPHTITFTEEEEPPLTAEDIQYSDTQTVKDAIDSLKSSVSNGKTLVASAITDKGVPTAQDATFAQMAENIGQISGGDTSDVTATSFDILSPKTAYTAAGKVEGVIPTLPGQTITPGTADKTIANGQYLGGTQVIKGDPNLTSGNIKKGVTLFGVEGALESSFKATLTVTADVGAVVTAAHTNGTEVEGLSTTGTVVLELPIEGTWKVTAVRGMAQYNTVTIQVSSSYRAELTAEVHVEYFGPASPLGTGRKDLSACSTSSLAIFAGGRNKRYDGVVQSLKSVDIYDVNLTHSANLALLNFRHLFSSTTLGEKIYLGGGASGVGANGAGTAVEIGSVEVLDDSLTIAQAENLSASRSNLASASISNHAIFGGGKLHDGTSVVNVDAYDEVLTHTTPTQLSVPCSDLAAASNENYAVFVGGNETSGAPTAYNSSLTRSIPVFLTKARTELGAAKAGNYIIFAGGSADAQYSDIVDAYDLFLTRTSPEPLSAARRGLKGTTLNGIAMFTGGVEETGSILYPPCGIVDTYDQFLVHQVQTELGTKRADHGVASIGSYALIGGGRGREDEYLNSVETYRYV